MIPAGLMAQCGLFFGLPSITALWAFHCFRSKHDRYLTPAYKYAAMSFEQQILLLPTSGHTTFYWGGFCLWESSFEGLRCYIDRDWCGHFS